MDRVSAGCDTGTHVEGSPSRAISAYIADMTLAPLLPPLRRAAVVAALTATALMAACSPNVESAAAPGASCNTRAYAEIGGPISLINQDGQRMTEADFSGGPTLVYFGFTYCPDICPMSLVTMRRAIDMLPEGVAAPQSVLISIDPERDTPEALARYVSSDAFPSGLVGLTGTDDEIAAAAKVFRSGYSRVDDPGSAAEYTMDHTSIIYLMDENWSLKTFFTHETDAATMSTCMAQLLPRD